MRQTSVKTLLLAAVVGVAGLTLAINDADAARVGGGKSVGKQSSNVTNKQAPAQAAPAPQQAAAGAAAKPAAAPPAPARNRWLGPLAGLAAGLGIAALLSHLGMGGALAEMMGSMLMIAGIALAAFFIWRMWRNRTNPAPALAGAGAGAGPNAAFDGAQPSSTAAFTPVAALPGGTAGASGFETPAATGTWKVPADFDVDNFLHIAKMYFVRLQAAWDSRNEEDIRNFTSPEMYAEIKLDLVARGDAANQTDVVSLEAHFLGIEEMGEQTMASVRLTGMLREAPGADAAPFNEVWNLVKPASAKASWVLAGIQQE